MEDSRWPMKIYQWTPHGRKRGRPLTIMEEPTDGLHEKQKSGRRYGRGYTSLAFGSRWTSLGCIDPDIKIIKIIIIIIIIIIAACLTTDHEAVFNSQIGRAHV